MAIRVMCHRSYPEDGHRQVCNVPFAECPLQHKDYQKVIEEPCCYGLWIPAKYLTEAKGDKQKAARKYIEWVLSESTQA